MGQVAGLSARELSRVRGRLGDFAGQMLAPLVRKDQRRWGEVYLRGLMLDGKRKSIEPMAARLADGDEQCLQQFINQSPWSAEAVRERLALRMSAEIVPEAWVIDDTGFLKIRPDVGRGRAPILRRPGQGRQLSDRRLDLRCHPPGLMPDRLGALPARRVG